MSCDKKYWVQLNIFSRKIVNILYPSVLTFVLGAQKNHLIEIFLMSTHNICFVISKK